MEHAPVTDLIFNSEPIEKHAIEGIYFKAVDVNTPVLFLISRKALKHMTRVTSYVNRSKLRDIFTENINYIRRVARQRCPDLELIDKYKYLKQTKQEAYLLNADLFQLKNL